MPKFALRVIRGEVPRSDTGDARESEAEAKTAPFWETARERSESSVGVPLAVEVGAVAWPVGANGDHSEVRPATGPRVKPPVRGGVCVNGEARSNAADDAESWWGRAQPCP